MNDNDIKLLCVTRLRCPFCHKIHMCSVFRKAQTFEHNDTSIKSCDKYAVCNDANASFVTKSMMKENLNKVETAKRKIRKEARNGTSNQNNTRCSV